MTGSNTTAREAQRGRLAELLLAHCITPTAQRLKLAEILLACPAHLSAERLLSLANREDPAVSKATVYNTLGLFAQRGLVREVVVDPAKVFYDSNPAEHYHFYDVSTGELTDIDQERIEIGDIPDLPPGASVEGIDVIVRIRSGGE
jgi:Fur family iron response transcriptional regulator